MTCNSPVVLPERPLKQAEVEKFWAIDRASLVTCRNQHDAHIQLYQDLQQRFSAAGS